MPFPGNQWAKAIFRPPLIVLGTFIVLFEEVFLVWFGRLMEAVARLPRVARIEATIRRLPPYPALALLLIPLLIIIPVKLVGLWLVAIGKVVSGGVLFVVGEVVGASAVARLYVLCRDSLRTLRWFAIAEQVVLGWSAWAHGWLDRMPLVRQVRTLAQSLLRRLRPLGYRWRTWFRSLRAQCQR